MRTYKLYVSATAALDAAVNILVLRPGRIKSIRWEASYDGGADNSRCDVELSTRPAFQGTTHDTAADLSTLRHFVNLTTSGAFQARADKQEFVDFPVAGNERLYLNVGTVTTCTGFITCYVDIEEGRA